MKHMTFRPVIAGVPVPIHLQIYTHLGKMYACQIEGELDATAGVKETNNVYNARINMQYEWDDTKKCYINRNGRPTAT